MISYGYIYYTEAYGAIKLIFGRLSECFILRHLPYNISNFDVYTTTVLQHIILVMHY